METLQTKVYNAVRNPTATVYELKNILLDVTLQLDYLDARERYILKLEAQINIIEKLLHELLEKC